MVKEREEVVVNENGERIIYRDRPKKRNPFLLGCMGLFGLLILLGACGAIFGLGDDTEKKDETKTEEVATEEETEEDVTTEKDTEEDVTTEAATEENTTEEVTTEVKKDEPTREQKAALQAAQQYINIMAFSKAGLFEQLTSDAGSGYPDDAAQYAIDNLKVDYKKQAVKAAEQYLKTMPMSDQQLYEQLVSQAGSKFTPEEAQYALDHINK